MKIIIAVDGASCSEAAVQEVAARPWPANSEIKLISAVYVPRPTAPDPLNLVAPMRLQLLEREQARLREVLVRHTAMLRDHSVDKCMRIETAVIEGEPKAAILEEAERWPADLVVVGCHGYGSIRRFLLGSVSLAVAVHAPCSVEIVRRHHAAWDMK